MANSVWTKVLSTILFLVVIQTVLGVLSLRLTINLLPNFFSGGNCDANNLDDCVKASEKNKACCVFCGYVSSGQCVELPSNYQQTCDGNAWMQGDYCNTPGPVGSCSCTSATPPGTSPPLLIAFSFTIINSLADLSPAAIAGIIFAVVGVTAGAVALGYYYYRRRTSTYSNI